MVAKPRVLIACPYPPTPPYAGGRRRIVELIKTLRSVAAVTVATVTFSEADDAAIVRGLPVDVTVMRARPTSAGGPTDLPSTFTWAWSRTLAQLIERCHAQHPFDVAIAAHSYAFPYVAGLDGAVRVLDAPNVEHRVHQQFSSLPDHERERICAMSGSGADGYRQDADDPADVAGFERRVWGAADVVLCVSRGEMSEIAAAPGHHRVLLVPNGATTDQDARSGSIENLGHVITFAGALNYVPNVDAVVTLVEEVTPIVQKSLPEIRVVIAGREPTPLLKQWCEHRGVLVIADPVEMAPVIRGSVMAVPLRMGSGTRIKILEARSNEVPVVASTIAAEGLSMADDPGLTICDDTEAMARCLVGRLLTAERFVPTSIPLPTWSETFQPIYGLLGCRG